MSLSNRVDVIIPSKTNNDNWPMVVKTIQSLKLSEPWFDFNVVLVESGELKNCGQNLTIDYEDKRFSYNRALNKGIAQTKADWVIMANNDLWFYPNWFSEIIKAWVDHPDIKSFSPWNNYHNWHPRLFPENKSSVLIGSRICRELAGWCIVARREMIETMDIDERCSLWFSDNIYADELEKHGYQHALVCSSLVDHLTSQTIDFSKYDTLEDQQLYFEGKK